MTMPDATVVPDTTAVPDTTVIPDARYALVLDKVGKAYPLFGSPKQMAAYCLGLYSFGPWRKNLRMFSALADVSFSVKRGERVAVVGRNGAGKTTLLKMLMGNFACTSGKLTVNGHVMSLMSGSMGDGINANLTGMENLVSQLQQNGHSGSKLESVIQETVDFLELGEFIYQPVTTYSLGMAARLTFATATAIHPEILLIDEVLGAGDAYFLEKCARRIEKITSNGCTLILVSHSTQQLLRFCRRAIWLRDHTVYMDGPAHEIIQQYDADIEWSAHQKDQSASGEIIPVTRCLADGREVICYPGRVGVAIQNCWFETSTGKTAHLSCTQMDSVDICIEVEAEEDIEASLRYIVTFWSPKGLRAAAMENTTDSFVMQKGERRTIHFHMEQCLLEPGIYPMALSIYDVSKSGLTSDVAGNGRHDVLVSALSLEVLPRGERHLFGLPAEWRHVSVSR